MEILTFIKNIKVICITILFFSSIRYGVIDTYAYSYPTPNGFCDNDYQKLIQFYLNGNQHLQWEISDPSKWHGVTWDGYPNKRVVSINLHNCQISGELDLSNFLEIVSVEVPDNELTHLNINNCPNILAIICNNNKIKWISGLDKINTNAYIATDGNPNITNVRGAISSSEIIDSFKADGNSLFVLRDAITLEGGVLNSIPIDYSANFTIVDTYDRFLYEWNFYNVPPASFNGDFNLKAELTTLNSNSANILSLKLASYPPPSARLKIDVSNHYNDGELLFIYSDGNKSCKSNSISSSHSLTNLASSVEVNNGIIDFTPMGEDIILSNMPIEIEESATSTTTENSTSTTTTTANTPHITSATAQRIDDDSNAGHTSTPSSTYIEYQDEYINTSEGNSDPASRIGSEEVGGANIEEPNPSTYGRSSLLFFPFMFSIAFCLSLYSRRRIK